MHSLKCSDFLQGTFLSTQIYTLCTVTFARTANIVLKYCICQAFAARFHKVVIGMGVCACRNNAQYWRYNIYLCNKKSSRGHCLHIK